MFLVLVKLLRTTDLDWLFVHFYLEIEVAICSLLYEYTLRVFLLTLVDIQTRRV